MRRRARHDARDLLVGETLALILGCSERPPEAAILGNRCLEISRALGE